MWTSGLQIRVAGGAQQGLVVPLNERSYVLGRAISHENVAPGRLFFHDHTVSLIQAILRWDDAHQVYLISHETEKSGSSISGLPLARGTPRPLPRGSRLKIGKLVLLVENAENHTPVAPPTPAPSEPPAMPTWQSESGERPAPIPVEAIPVEVMEAATPWDGKVDHSWFKTKVYKLRREDRLDGPVAEFFPDGQLKRLGIYHRDELSTTHNQLLLEHGIPVGRVVSDFTDCTYADGVEKVLTQFEGDVDVFEEKIAWQAWVTKWIDLICGRSTVSALPDELAS